MILKDAMIVWTPARGVFENEPTAGQIAVTTIPQPAELRAHPMSTGACDLDWRETTDVGRRELLQRYFTQFIHRDHLNDTAVRDALGVIEDINTQHLSAKAPPEGDDSWR